MAIRLQLRAIPIRDIRDVEAMASLDAAARAKVTASESIADAFIGLAFVTQSAQDLERRLAAIGPDADRTVQGNATALRSLERLADDSLREGFLHERKGLPFHWPLEFPEVFLREHPGFDAFVGNPPFLGNRLWKGTQGTALQRIVQLVLGVAPRKIDLSVAFHRRAAELLRADGAYGLLATNNIAEGSAVSVGLEPISKTGNFFFTQKGLPWPGSASTVVAIVCFRKGSWTGNRRCNDVVCVRIGPRLEPEVAGGWEPKPMHDAVFAFEGVNNSKGLEFVITKEHAWFDRLRSERKSLLRPYVTGDDIASGALTRVERWALDIADMPLVALARQWPIAHAFIVEVVKPTRTPQALKSYKGLIDRWWQFWNHRADQMRRLREQPHCIAFCKVAKYPVCMRAPTEWLYTNKVILVEDARPDLLAICLSSPFREWVSRFSLQSLGGDNNTLSLSISEAFGTFPQPMATTSKVGIDAAAKFQEMLTSWSKANRKGMTDAMNAVNSRAGTGHAIQELRQLLEKIDGAVKSAYGWTDVDLSHDLRDEVDAEGAPVTRCGISAAARDRVLGALLALNRERHEQAQSKPLVGKKRAVRFADGEFELRSPGSTSGPKAAARAKKASIRRTSR